MKYFLGYLIQGEAAKWHTALAKDISDKFNTWKIYEKVPPHITIFQPFNIDDVGPIQDLLNTWCKTQTDKGSMTISGFDHFDDRVVFAKIIPDAVSELMAKTLKKQLQTMPNMPEENYPLWHPHATLAERLEPEKITAIWEYVSTLEKPDFILPFDNVTLFSYTSDKTWSINKVFQIR